MDLIKTFKETKGHLSKKAKAICVELEVDLVWATENYIQAKRGNNCIAYTDGDEIVMVGIKDKLDLFTFFHEVGHVILHHKKNISSDVFASNLKFYEKQADDFAEEIMRKLYKNINNVIWTCRNF